MRAYYFNAAVGALLLTSQCLADFSLSQLQPIAGFSDVCTQAYETPLTACTISDFYEDATCSAQCIAFLEAMTKLLNDECKGITAFPDTLIGMFFQKTAVKKLCPNVEVTTVSAAGVGQGSKPSEPEPTADSTAAPSQVSIKLTSTTSKVISTTTTSLAAPSTSTSSAAFTTTSTTLAFRTTSLGSDALGGTASPSISSGRVSASAVTSSSAKQPKSTSVNQGGSEADNDGNGGTVLDAASAAAHGTQTTTCLFSVIAALSAAMWCL